MKTLYAGFKDEKNLYPIIANIILFLSMMSKAPLTIYGFVEVVLLMFIANKIYFLINLYELDIANLGRIALFSFLSLIAISQFFQHAFNFSFVDWLVSFTEFSKQAPMSIFGICAFVALPLGAGIAVNAHYNKYKRG
ncbi:hypothetical protein [Pseudomonas caricapapayae]|nr:hypothetical protein [Pseudomonas caricapapayae]